MEYPKLLDAQVANMPLQAITEILGTDGLIQRFVIEVGKLATASAQEEVNQAFLVASHLHSGDKRVREPYLSHPLRVAIRMMIYYGVTDADVLSAALMHDCVEDHSDMLTRGDDEAGKPEALLTLEEWFNLRVSRLVGGVTNPDFDPALDKNVQYLEHLSHIVEADDPWFSVIKLSDFTDNATGLIYTTGPKVQRSAIKYLPAVPILRSALDRPNFPLSRSVITHIHQQLDLTIARLTPLAS